MTYSDKLKDPRWQKKRLEILARDNWTCQKCMDNETTLHVHHLKYNGNPWESDEGDLITLCKHCHEFIENEKARDMKIFKWSWEDDSVIMFGSTDEGMVVRVVDTDNNYSCSFKINNFAQELQIWLAGQIY